MSGEFGGLSVPAELFIILCALAGIFVALVAIWLQLVLTYLQGKRPEPGRQRQATRPGEPQ